MVTNQAIVAGSDVGRHRRDTIPFRQKLDFEALIALGHRVAGCQKPMWTCIRSSVLNQ